VDGTSQTRPNKSTPFSFRSCQTEVEAKDRRTTTRGKCIGSLFHRSMSNSNNETNVNDRSNSDNSSESSIFVQVIPGNQLTEASLSDSQSEPSTGERERRCIIEIGVEAPLSSPGRKGVTVRVLQSNLHRVRIYTPLALEQAHEAVNPNEDAIRVWDPSGCLPWKFEIEITEREHEETNPLKRPASRPGSPQQEAGGPREASRRLNR